MQTDMREILGHVAREKGVSEQEVLSEMQKAIDEAYANPDPAIRAQWEAMPFAGKPTPEELIMHIVRYITQSL